MSTDKIQILNRPYFPGLPSKEFGDVFIHFANKWVRKDKPMSVFELDPRTEIPVNNNRYIINQLYYYFVGSDKFKGDFENQDGDLNKGILLIGKIGPGKTVLMKSFIDLWNYYVHKYSNSPILQPDNQNRIKQITAHNLFNRSLSLKTTAEREWLNKLLSSILYIDDLGKEEESANDFGTKKKPLSQALTFRYENGKLTFATGNYSIDKTYSKIYGKAVADRMVQMFNVIRIDGESRR